MNRKAAQQLRDQRYQNAYGLLDLADDYKQFRQNNLDNNSRLLTGQMPMNESIQYVLDETVPGPDFGQVFGGLLGMTKKAGKAIDLPMDEASRLARAKEMGFDTDNVWYHGTNKDFDAFDTADKSSDFNIPNNLGDNIGAFFSNKEIDAKYFGDHIKDNYLSFKKPKVFKTQADWRDFVRSNVGLSDDVRDAEGFIVQEGKPFYNTRKTLEDAGYDGVIIQNSNFDNNNKSSWAIALHPNQIRSTKAKFDPSKKDSANLLASGLLGAIGLGGLLGYQGDNVD